MSSFEVFPDTCLSCYFCEISGSHIELQAYICMVLFLFCRWPYCNLFPHGIDIHPPPPCNTLVSVQPEANTNLSSKIVFGCMLSPILNPTINRVHTWMLLEMVSIGSPRAGSSWCMRGQAVNKAHLCYVWRVASCSLRATLP